jgi:signal transduction histidine kinase
MPWSLSIYMVPSLVAGVVSAVVAGLAWQHREERTARPFIALMVGLSWWATAYGIELGFSSAAEMVLWDKIAFVGSVTVPAALFLLALEYAGYDDQLPGWSPVVLAVEPAITLGLVWLYPGSRLVWESVSVQSAGGLVLPLIQFGPWYWVNYVYSYLLIGAALVVIGSVYVRGSQLYRRQAALLIVGAVVPLIANLLYNLWPTLTPFPHVDLTTVAMAVTGGLYGLALFRFKMLDLVPVARSMLLGEIGDGFLVTDHQGRVVEGNEVGRQVATAALTDADGVVNMEELQTLAGEVVTAEVGGMERSYELRLDDVTDFRDETLGTLVVSRDITELAVVRRQEQRLSVMNRVLRHNIRNQMNVIGGYGDLLAESADGEDARYARSIADRARRMHSMAEKARQLQTLEPDARAREPVALDPIADAIHDWAATEYPEATVRVTRPDGMRALATGSDDLQTALSYLVENAVVHNDREDPIVAVGFEAADGHVSISVADDGPGIPPGERAVLEADVETQLDHGSGLGLWIVQWIVSQSDGDLRIQENEPRGSVVEIRLDTPKRS